MLLIFLINFGISQNPHGDNLKIDCKNCHTSDSWEIDSDYISFDHSITNFQLNGLHKEVDCKNCHLSLIFTEINDNCIDCHQDIHQNTVYPSCSNCHDESSWLISDIDQMHDQTGFPLFGAHVVVQCNDCHDKIDELIFEPISNECISCHADDFYSTLEPNHEKENYSFDCYLCHELDANNWLISHDFFPLEEGHNIEECVLCHDDNNYLSTSSDCISCHEIDYNKTSNPDHNLNMFGQDCTECHSLSLDWMPVEYKSHDENDFPIYSGKHKGEWNSCIDCHLISSDYSIFTCIDCHEHQKSDMDNKHNDVSGYNYESTSCFECHPDGDK